MNSQRLKQLSQDLHGSAPSPLHIYYSFQFTVMGLLIVRTSEFLILVPTLEDLSFFLLSSLALL